MKIVNWIILAIILASAYSCSGTPGKKTNQAMKTDRMIVPDTIILSKNMIGEVAGSAYLKKAREYFAVIKNDSSDFTPVFKESKENGKVDIDLYLPYSNQTGTYAQRMDEFKLILAVASKDFSFDSLNSISVGRLILTGDLAIDITNDYVIKFGQDNTIATSDYSKISDFLFNTKLASDFNRLFGNWSKKVNKIIIEKAFFTTKEDLLNNSCVETDKSGMPDYILDCIVWVKFDSM